VVDFHINEDIDTLVRFERMTSKSLPPTEFQVYISSADSGIDSDASNSTTKLSSIESIEDEFPSVDPTSLLAGRNASHEERVEGIGKALDWLRHELVKMKQTDKRLTKTFITMRSKIAEHKLLIESGAFMPVEKPIYCDGITTDDCTATIKNRNNKKLNKNDDWRLIAKDGAFPANGLDFENNKRATWVI